jgi:hypothetical protein
MGNMKRDGWGVKRGVKASGWMTLLKFSQIPNDYTQFAPCKEF